MVGEPLREQTRRMTLPTVVEITQQPKAVTPDTFIDGLTAPARGSGLATDSAATSQRERR